MGILTGAAFSLVGGIVAGVTSMKIRITNEKLRRGICGAIAGMFLMIAVERILPTSLFPILGSIDFPFFTLIMGTIAGASAGSFSAFYIGKPAFAHSTASAFADSALSAAEGCALASFIWVLGASLIHTEPGAIFFTFATLGSAILAIIGVFIGVILGGLLGLCGQLIGYAGNRALTSLVGLTCGTALATMISIILLGGLFAQ